MLIGLFILLIIISVLHEQLPCRENNSKLRENQVNKIFH
jgi:hypothetical protein